MNNCYGRNGDMQQRLVSIYPEFGYKFQVLICVPDTDDGDQIEEYIDLWVGEHLRFVDHWNEEESDSPLYVMRSALWDNDGNEVEVFSPSDSFSLKDYMFQIEDEADDE